MSLGGEGKVGDARGKEGWWWWTINSNPSSSVSCCVVDKSFFDFRYKQILKS